VVDPEELAKVPPAHCWQVLDPLMLAKVPASHC
jgi:hypothetical protein